MTRILLFLILSSTVAGCTDRPSDPRLSRIEELASQSPDEALDSLGGIDYDLLSDADRHYHDFLSVKVADKAYVTHTTDSLILKVIAYESEHKSTGRYPEALYYGGRVYSDLGDSPTALRYFQESLKSLPADAENLRLKNRILSQTARLLTNLSLHDEAIHYIYESLEIDRQLQDTVSIIYDLQLLGVTCILNNKYTEAEKYFKESLGLCDHQLSYHRAKSRMYIAAAKHKLGEMDSALIYIRNTLDSVRPISRNTVLGYGATIYLDAGILDTAYMYAKDIITNSDPAYNEIGYQVILSPKLQRFIDPDTLLQYIAEYRTVLVDYYDENNMKLALNQQNLYNYQLHETRKAEAEKTAGHLKRWVAGSAFLVILLALVSLYLKNKSKNNIIELQRALSVIEKLKYELATRRPDTGHPAGTSSEPPETRTTSSPMTKVTEQGLRESLKEELISLYESSNAQPEVSPVILQSEAYRQIQEHIQEGKAIKDSDDLWSEIEQVVLCSSPKFKTNLHLLTSGLLTMIDLHTALLIKCGIKPSKMTTLLGRSHGAIVSRRETLCMKILDEKKGTKTIDAIIRLL